MAAVQRVPNIVTHPVEDEDHGQDQQHHGPLTDKQGPVAVVNQPA